MRSLSLDIETYSSADLTKTGVYRYAEAQDFTILLFAYAEEGGETQVVDLARGEEIPPAIVQALFEPSVLKWAYNAQFERICLSRYFGQHLSPASWRCTLVWAATLGLPLSLEGAGEVLGLKRPKLKEGKELLRYFSLPCQPTKANGGRLRNLPEHAPEQWEAFKAYNAHDVEAERELRAWLNPFPVPEQEWEHYVLDQEINDYGIRLDLTLVEQALRCEAESRRVNLAKAQAVTGLANPNSPTQLKAWLADQGYPVEKLNKEEVSELLERAESRAWGMEGVEREAWSEEDAGSVESAGYAKKAGNAEDAENAVSTAGTTNVAKRINTANEISTMNKMNTPNTPSAPSMLDTISTPKAADLANPGNPVAEALRLRQDLAKSSVKKYAAMAAVVGRDERARGLLQFYGASRTGRYAGRLIQIQNLPQNHLPDLAQARKLLRSGRFGALELLYDSVPSVLSELIRTAFIPESGSTFQVADYSAVEARVIAWLAGESWRLEVFASHGRIYEASAAKMFRVPLESIGKNSPLRQKGKIAELALGYGGSVGALQAMGALKMGLQAEELQPLVNAWRSANPRIVRLWWEVERAVCQVVETNTRVQLGPLSFSYERGLLFIRLPSGRRLSYVRPRLELTPYGRTGVTYEGSGPTKKWERISGYGPKFVENIIQGIARDLLAEALLRLDREGYRIVMHCHDEIVVEVAEKAERAEDSGEPNEDFGERDRFCRLMAQTPAWAEGLPLRAEGFFAGEFYQKA